MSWRFIAARGLSPAVHAGTIIALDTNEQPLNFKAATAEGEQARAELALKLASRGVSELCWLALEHKAHVALLASSLPATVSADAAVIAAPGLGVAFTTADCLPIVISAETEHGVAVAAVHGGWRCLAGGIIEAAVLRLREAVALRQPEAVALRQPEASALCLREAVALRQPEGVQGIETDRFDTGGLNAGADPCQNFRAGGNLSDKQDNPTLILSAWIGPGIQKANYEVSFEVKAAFLKRPAIQKACQQAAGQQSSELQLFAPTGAEHCLADLPALATLLLEAAGVARQDVQITALDTFVEPALHSARRDKDRSGRMATVVYLESAVRAE